MKSKGALLRELIAKEAIMIPAFRTRRWRGKSNMLDSRPPTRAGQGWQRDGGVPDIGLLGLSEVVQLAGYIAKAVKIPVVVDADTGFGGAENVARTIRELESAGLAGCHIEDQEFPSVAGISPENRLSIWKRWSEKSKRP